MALACWWREPVVTPFSRSAAIVTDGERHDLDALQPSICRLGRTLQDLGIERLAVMLDNGLTWVVADLACRETGICSVPLPTWFSSSQLDHVVRTTGVQAVMCPPGAWPLPQLASRVTPLDESTALIHLKVVGAAAALPPGTGKVTFTSGSTGVPKGVCLSNEQLDRQARFLSAAVGLNRPRHLCVLPLSTLLENVAGVYAPLMSGGDVIVPSLAEVGFTGSSRLDSNQFIALISRTRPESLILTPELLQLLVLSAQRGWSVPDSLVFVAVGGARTAPVLLEEAQSLGIPVYEGYGLSECASVVSLNLPGRAKVGSCGHPLDHLDVRLVDSEVIVAGNAMLGYADEPESWGQETIRTGDLGSFDSEGFLHIEGRRKNLIISSFGRNISPEWVESQVLAEAAFSDCVVFGDARPYCVALLSTASSDTPDAAIQTSLERINATLPDYAHIRAWCRLARPLSSEPELKTANGRPVRDVILSRYRHEIEHLYQ